MTYTQLIAEDEEISKLLIQAFKWSGRPYSVNETMDKIRKLMFEKYDIDLEIYT